MKKIFSFALIIALSLTASAQETDKSKRLSPPASVSQTIESRSKQYILTIANLL